MPWTKPHIRPECEGWYTVVVGDCITEMLFENGSWFDVLGISSEIDYWLLEDKKKVYAE